MIVTKFYYWPDDGLWFFCVVAGEDDVLASGTAETIEEAALMARTKYRLAMVT